MPQDVDAGHDRPRLTKNDARHDHDILLIGAGQASVPLAPKLAGRGYRVALAEREHMGGSCVNFGCLPTKAAHASARVAHLARRAGEFGIDIRGAVEADLAEVLLRARAMSEEAERYISRNYAESDVTLLPAHARLAGRTDGGGFRVSLDNGGQISSVTAGVVVVDTGSRTKMPPVPGLAEADPITAETWLRRDRPPGRLLMLGGGYIGVESAQFYRRMGADVTLAETNGQILSKEDADVAGIVREALGREGVRFRLGARLQRVERSGGSFVCSFDSGEAVECDTIFVAIGRRPNTGDLGLDSVGVTPGEKGFLDTDEFGGVSGCEGLYAVGDVRGGPAFTHSAHDDHHILRGHLLGGRDPGGSASRRGRIVPWAVFTDPEIGRVGANEREAREKGLRHEVVTVNVRRNDRARAVGEGEGLVKLIVDPDDDRLLGAAVVGPSAGELVHAFVMLMHLGRPITGLLDATFIHPTLFEIVHSSIDTYWKKKRS